MKKKILQLIIKYSRQQGGILQGDKFPSRTIIQRTIFLGNNFLRGSFRVAIFLKTHKRYGNLGTSAGRDGANLALPRCVLGCRSELHQITPPQSSNPEHLSLFIFTRSDGSEETAYPNKTGSNSIKSLSL